MLQDGNFKIVFKTPLINACEVIEKSSNIFAFKGILEYVQRLAPGFVHECPYEGVYF